MTDDDLIDEVDEELHEISQEVGMMVKEFTEKVHPLRIALAGVILLMILGSIMATWYWVIPRDDVEIEVIYIQRSGHIIMVELVNDGSRAITDVELTVEFLDSDSNVISGFTSDFANVPSHSSITGDGMELIVRGYTVWDEYTIHIEIQWTDFNNRQNFESFDHPVSEAAYEKFVDDCEGTTWFL